MATLSRVQKRKLLESHRDETRRRLHSLAVAYTEDGAGTKAQADLEEAARDFASAVRILAAFDKGKRL